MKTLTIFLLTVCLSLGQATNDLYYQTKAATGYSPHYLPPSDGQLLGWSGGLLSNISVPLSDYLPLSGGTLTGYINFGDIDSGGVRDFYSAGNVHLASMSGHILYSGASGAEVTSIDWENKTLHDAAGNPCANFSNSSFLIDAIDGLRVPFGLRDGGGINSVDPYSRTLLDTTGTAIYDWSTGTLVGSGAGLVSIPPTALSYPDAAAQNAHWTALGGSGTIGSPAFTDVSINGTTTLGVTNGSGTPLQVNGDIVFGRAGSLGRMYKSGSLIFFDMGVSLGTGSLAAGTITASSTLTGSSATNTLTLSPTWNTAGNPTLIYGRVTNTASGSTSNLIDLGTVAGGAMFKVDKFGALTVGKLSASIPAYANDAAADADATLLTGQLYKITGSRNVYQKP